MEFVSEQHAQPWMREMPADLLTHLPTESAETGELLVPAFVVANLLERLLKKGVLSMEDLQHIANDPTLRESP